MCVGWHVACLLSICVGWHVACLLSICVGWHVACLLSMCVGLHVAVCVLAGPETAGLPRSQGCGPVMGSSGSPGWLLAFGLVMFMVRGVVEGLGGGQGPGLSTVVLGATVGVLTPAGAGLGVFDAGTVADLGLPMSAADLGLVDPVRVDGAVAVENQWRTTGVLHGGDSAHSPCQAGQMYPGRRICGHGGAVPGSSPGGVQEGEDQKSSEAKFRPVADRDAWVAGFAQYAGVVCRTHLGRRWLCRVTWQC